MSYFLGRSAHLCPLCYFRLAVIDKCFSHETVEEIVDALVSDGSTFYFHDMLIA